MKRWKQATAAALAALGACWAWAVWSAPIDALQGSIARIVFVHPPLAFAAYLGFGLTALSGGVYLAKRRESWDRFALASAEVGVVFCTLMLATAVIWAKAAWGKWWSWDPRTTVTLLLYLVYVAYLLLRAYAEGSERAARFGAVYAIAGLAVVPLNYFAIDLAGGRAIHPDNVSRGSFGPGMLLPFLLGIAAALAAFAFLLVRRFEVGELLGSRKRRSGKANELRARGLRRDASHAARLRRPTRRGSARAARRNLARAAKWRLTLARAAKYKPSA